MTIKFECPRCAKVYKLADGFAGKRVKCAGCQSVVAVPENSSFEEPTEVEPVTEPDEVADTEKDRPKRPKRKGKSKKKSAGFDFHHPAIKYATAGVIVLLIVLKVAFQHLAHPPGSNAPNATASLSTEPVAAPSLPPLGEPQRLEAGVLLHEIQLAGSGPGQQGKLWLYLPEGTHADKSLACVLIAPAGSILVVGMGLADGDRVEHLPYVRAGFAVLAYELDGPLNNLENPRNQEFKNATAAFQVAQGGLVNAKIALEFILARVPQVDPQRVFAAGHSSAGTVALLFAEHEPRLKACVAYAPAYDIVKFQSAGIGRMESIAPGIRAFAANVSPKTHVGQLRCPAFLFHAEDDTNVRAADGRAFAGQCPSAKLVIVPAGGHYDSMINQGIPQAIAWMKGLP